jgi:hypothetical protein
MNGYISYRINRVCLLPTTHPDPSEARPFADPVRTDRSMSWSKPAAAWDWLYRACEMASSIFMVAQRSNNFLDWKFEYKMYFSLLGDRWHSCTYSGTTDHKSGHNCPVTWVATVHTDSHKSDKAFWYARHRSSLLELDNAAYNIWYMTNSFEPKFVMQLKNGVFWDVTPCGSCKNRRFDGTYKSHTV